MAANDPTPNPDEFKSTRRRILRALTRAIETAIGAFYPECDLTIQIRNGKCLKLDLREIETLTN